MFSLKQLFVDNFFWCCGLTIFCLLLIYDLQKRFRQYSLVKKYFPKAFGLPFIGILHKFSPDYKFLYVLGSYFYKLNSWSYMTWFADKSLIVTIDTDIVKRILNSEEFLNKADVIYSVMDDALSNGIITSKYFKWKHNRKIMNPSFTPQIVQHFIPNFNKCSEVIKKYFESLKEGEGHEIGDRLKQEILQMAVGTTMGQVIGDGEDFNKKMSNVFNELLESMVSRIKLSFLKLTFMLPTKSYYGRIDSLKAYMKNFIHRRMDLNVENQDIYFLDRAIKYQQKGIFKLDDTITETFTMIIGSFETVSTTLHSLIVMLAMHPHVQEKLYQEIMDHLSNTENIEYDHLSQLNYLTMVIDETYRLAPPIPLIGRENLENCYLTDNIELPRDSQILISIFHLHRRPDLWGANAEQFNPDNFLPENIEKRHPYAFIPFSKGVRNCIGWRYAQIALRFLLVNLVRDFKFSTDFPYNKLIYLNHVSLRFHKEPKIQFVKRNSEMRN